MQPAWYTDSTCLPDLTKRDSLHHNSLFISRVCTRSLYLTRSIHAQLAASTTVLSFDTKREEPPDGKETSHFSLLRKFNQKLQNYVQFCSLSTLFQSRLRVVNSKGPSPQSDVQSLYGRICFAAGSVPQGPPGANITADGAVDATNFCPPKTYTNLHVKPTPSLIASVPTWRVTQPERE